MRAFLFWTHLTLGVAAGVVILILSLSGMLLGYERQMVAWIDAGGKVVAAPGATRLPLDVLLERAAIPRANVASVALRADPSQPVIVRLLDPRALPVMLDPFTGASVPLPIGGNARRAFSWVREWHLFLGSPEGSLRSVARAASGAAMLALVLIVPLGMFLWWPVTWTSAAVRATVLPRFDLRGRARNFNWHNSVGVWSAAPLFVIALTAVFLSYQWPGLWLDRALGSPAEKSAAIAAMDPPPAPPSANRPAAASKPNVATPPVRADTASPSALFATIERVHPAWQSVMLTMATPRSSVVQVVVAEGNTFRPDLRRTLMLDPVNATPTRVVSYESFSVSRRLRSWVRYTHTGEAFGMAGQTVATAASGGAILLAWTGLTLAWRRFWRRRTRLTDS